MNFRANTLERIVSLTRTIWSANFDSSTISCTILVVVVMSVWSANSVADEIRRMALNNKRIWETFKFMFDTSGWLGWLCDTKD